MYKCRYTHDLPTDLFYVNTTLPQNPKSPFAVSSLGNWANTVVIISQLLYNFNVKSTLKLVSLSL